MNATEAVRLCRLVKALCPSQPLDEFTPDAWAVVLDDIGYDAAVAAIRRIYRDQGDDAEWVRKIEADDIIRQVKRDRRTLTEKVGDAVPPAGLTQVEERRWFRELYRRAGNGEHVDLDTRGALVPGPRLQLAGTNIRDDRDDTDGEAS